MIKWLLGAIGWSRHFVAAAPCWIAARLARSHRTIVVEANLPTILKKRALYVVRDDGLEEQVAMLCPCGRNHVLHMNLLPDDRPRWHVTHHTDGTSTLHPSVWRRKDCHSHFWLRRGRIVWIPTDSE